MIGNKNLKIIFGIIGGFILFLGFVFAVGTQLPAQVYSGTFLEELIFSGSVIFTGNVDFTSATVDGLGEGGSSGLFVKDKVKHLWSRPGAQGFCASYEDGDFKCWGLSTEGSLGSVTNNFYPTRIGVSNVTQAVLGFDYMFLIVNNDSLYAMGDNSQGFLGDGTTTSTSVPIHIMDNVEKVQSGGFHDFITCALKKDGSVWCWGSNEYGEVGDGTVVDVTTPKQIISSGAKDIYIHSQIGLNVAGGGAYHDVLVIKDDGTVFGWGYNANGELGDSTTVQKTSPIRVSILTDIIKVGMTGGPNFASYAIDVNGDFYCWGYNAYGQLGLGDVAQRTSPQVLSLSNVKDVYPDDGSELGSVCAVLNNGELYCWGHNTNGVVGNGLIADVTTPYKVMDDVDFLSNYGSGNVAVSTNVYLIGTRCAVKTDGTVWCWGGTNVHGAMGDGSITASYVPKQVLGLKNIVEIKTAFWQDIQTHCALDNQGIVWCWGNGATGQVGNGQATPVTTIVSIPTPIRDFD